MVNWADDARRASGLAVAINNSERGDANAPGSQALPSRICRDGTNGRGHANFRAARSAYELANQFSRLLHGIGGAVGQHDPFAAAGADARSGA